LKKNVKLAFGRAVRGREPQKSAGSLDVFARGENGRASVLVRHGLDFAQGLFQLLARKPPNAGRERFLFFQAIIIRSCFWIATGALPRMDSNHE